MLTPRDLLQVQFNPAFRGYNRAQVDEFIRRLIGEYEKLARENSRLKETQVSAPAASRGDDPETEAVVAQIIEEARQEAEEIVADAQQRANREAERLAALRQETIGFQRRMRTLLDEFTALLGQGEAETGRLAQLFEETWEEEASVS